MVVLADRKSHNGTDEALETIADGVDRFLFLYRGSPLPLPWASPVPRWPLFRKPPACDVLYVRVDWFDRTLRDGLALNMVEWLRPKKVVVGIHCHLCTRDPREEALLGRADAALFLNARARDYFVAKYPGHAWHAKTFLLPSLFLPKRSWYAGATNECSRSETETVVAIPGNVNRLSGLPRQPAEVVPDEFSALNRYDYLRMVRLVAKDPRVRLRIFGSFENLGYPAAERVRALYA
ncbi:MAG: hypothetical protein JNL97_03545, partial [Verrucomicrobiales bacterium]|nr:hypothetical protein [Verrucomicrobiales bacterium]